MVENLSLFEMEEQDQEQIRINRSGALDIVKMEFSGAESLSWQELFSGYDSLHAITYSSGISFVYRLLDLFTDAEIIFGCDEVISYSLQEIMAYQYKTIERMRETAGRMKLDLISRIEAETLRFYVARSVLSHEKIYLLSAKDGRKRVIMGSANLTFSAFGGKQRENICYLDGDRAYDWYWDQYCQLREDSTDQIAKEALLCANDGENLEELPIARTIRTKKALIIQPITEVREEVRFSLDIRNLAAKFTPSVPKPDKKGKLMLSPEKIKSIRRQVISNQEKENELQSVYPQLEVSPDEGIARLNGKILDLSPTREEIARDVGLFLKYMDGYEKFHGDVAGMQRRYYEFANWFFCSPFMAGMRDTAVRYNQNLLPYPVFGLVYGQSKAGKTSFLETLLKMMIGQKTKLSAPDFTRSSIENLKRTVKGAPIIVDDLTNTRFSQHAVETIKNDDFGVAEQLTHYPAVVISANEDVKAVAQEIIRRTVHHRRRGPPCLCRYISEGPVLLHAGIYSWSDRHTGAGRRQEHPGHLQEHRPQAGYPDRRGDWRAGSGAVHPHPHQHRLDQGTVQQRPVQHPGSGEQDLRAGAQPTHCGYLAPVCKGQADCDLLRLRQARPKDRRAAP